MSKNESKNFEHNFAKNFERIGHLFMQLLWIENRLSQLIIFKKYPHFINDLNESNSNKTLPTDYVEIRRKYWEGYFAEIKNEFSNIFVIPDKIKEDLEWAYTLRNAIGHSIVSGTREYMLYSPTGSIDKKEQIIKALKLEKKEDSSTPILIELSFYNDYYYNSCIETIMGIHSFFDNLAESIGVKINITL